MKRSPRILAGLLLLLALQPGLLQACTACYGKSDSPLAEGMNWGIMSLLVVVTFVLGSISAFFVFIARRAASMAANDASGSVPDSTQKS